MRKNFFFLTLLMCFLILHGFLFTFGGKFLNKSLKTSPKISESLPNLPVSYEWNRTWGGSSGDGGSEILIDSSYNIYVVGFTGSFSIAQTDLCLLKYNVTGDLIWYVTWGSALTYKHPHGTMDSDNNIYIAAQLYISGQYNLIIVKFDKNGNYIWNRTWDSVGGGSERVSDIAVDSKNNVYVALGTYYGGNFTSFMTLVKYNSSGNLIWQVEWARNDIDDYDFVPNGVTINPHDEIFITGSYGNVYGGNPDANIFLNKYNSSGYLIWNRIYGGNNIDMGEDLIFDSQENIYITGQVSSHGAGRSDVILIKCNSSGFQEWNTTWGGSEIDVGEAIKIDSNNNIYIGGYTYSWTGNGYNDFIALKFDDTGVLIWNETWGLDYYDNGLELEIDNTNNIYLTGSHHRLGFWYNLTLVKYSNSLPIIIINSPYQNEYFSTNPPICNVSIIDSELNSTWYSLNNNPTNYTFNGNVFQIDQDGWDSVNNGAVSINIYANDSYGNTASINFSVIKDAVFPNISIVSPTLNQLFGNNSPNFELVIDDSNLDSTWYQLGNDPLNYLFSGTNGIIDQNAWDLLGNGTTTIRFYANDTLGNEGYKEIIIHKDNTGPLINIIKPIQYQIYGNSTFSFELNMSEGNLHKTWYTFDNGVNNYMFQGNIGVVDQDAWNNVGNGTAYLKFVANDTLGNIGSSTVFIRKNIYNPVILVNLPKIDDVFGFESPFFNISVSGVNINTTWYTIDGGITNYTINELTGPINQTAWDKLGSGIITIRFYANNSNSYLDFKDIYVIKDLISPLVIINSPVKNQLDGIQAATFSLFINEINLQQKWYSFNGGDNITFTTETQFDQIEWDKIGNGTVLITFYVRDKAGNMNLSEVRIRKDAFIPVITIHTPLNSEIFGRNPPDFNISIIEEYLALTWYTVSDSRAILPMDKYFTGTTGTIDQDLWDVLYEEEIRITFYAQDSAGNIGTAIVHVTKSLPSEPAIPGYNLFLLYGIVFIGFVFIIQKRHKS